MPVGPLTQSGRSTRSWCVLTVQRRSHVHCNTLHHTVMRVETVLQQRWPFSFACHLKKKIKMLQEETTRTRWRARPQKQWRLHPSQRAGCITLSVLGGMKCGIFRFRKTRWRLGCLNWAGSVLCFVPILHLLHWLSECICLLMKESQVISNVKLYSFICHFHLFIYFAKVMKS